MRLDDVVRLIIKIEYFYAVSKFLAFPFANSDLSLECPGKDVSTIRQESLQFELALILYYASWCRESRAAKEVYTEVSRQYDDIQFSAVDCWHLECNCSRTIPSSFGSKKGYPQKWPTLIVHYGRQMASLSIQYHDEWSVTALSRFINNLFRPVLRINSKDDLKVLNMHSNAVLLGLFPNANTLDYQRFTIAAVKWLENDPEKYVVFAVCMGNAAEEIFNDLGTHMPLIVLLNDKEIEVFNAIGSSTWRPNQLITWLRNEFKRLSRNFKGLSSPSLLLEHVRKGTTLAIFASDFEQPNRNFYVHISNVMQSLGFTPSIVTVLKKCKKLYNQNAQSFFDNEIQRELYAEFDNSKTPLVCKAPSSIRLNSGYKPFLNIKSYEKFSQQFMMKFQPSVQLQVNDHYSTTKLMQFYEYNECLKAYQNQSKPELQILFGKLLTKFIDKIAKNSTTRFNRTMSVQILDTNKYYDILETLGATTPKSFDMDIPNMQKTTVIIIEPNQEGIYVLQKQFHYEALLGFIRDYYHDNLSITRKTVLNSVDLLKHTLSSPSSSSSSSSATKQPTESIIYSLQELSRQTFLHRMQHFSHNTTTVLLFYTPRCAFSSMMSHALVQVSALLHSNKYDHHINIMRINTQTNDLPWEYTTHSTPALIVFPRGRPSESRSFPSNFRIDVRNVFAFIISQLEPIKQLNIALGSCTPSQHGSQQRINKCLNFVKTLAMQHIGDHLKLWQVFEYERQTILKRLRQFKDITLDIQHRLFL